MSERKKFTYRFDEETEKLLNEALQSYKLSSLNKLIDLLIRQSLVLDPKKIEDLSKEIKKLNLQLKSALEDKLVTESKYNQLKSCILHDLENKKLIEKLIS